MSPRACARWRRPSVLVGAFACLVLTAITIGLGVVYLLGWKLEVIKTSSMTPRLPSGSVVVVQPVTPAQVHPGMTIVFEDPVVRGRLVAHRVVRSLPADQPTWVTKGDANHDTDPVPVTADALRGRVSWSVPGLGAVVVRLLDLQTGVALVGAALIAFAVTERHARRARTRPV